MSSNGNQTRDELLAVALAGGATRAQAAQVAGVSARTVSRRLSSPEFQMRVHRARRNAYDQALGLLSRAAARAVETLEELLSGEQSASVRLGAARAVVDLSMKLREHVELESRVAALEVGTEPSSAEPHSVGTSFQRGAG